MTLSASEMRKISVAFHTSGTPSPNAEETVQAITAMAQVVAQQGEWNLAYKGRAFDRLDVGDEPNSIQEDIIDRLASLGYSPRIERLGGGLIVGW